MARRLLFALLAGCLLFFATQTLAADPCTDLLRRAMRMEGLTTEEIGGICKTAASLQTDRRPEITAEQIEKDIAGKMVSSWIFQKSEWRDIDILESKYDKDHATITINVDTIRNKTGSLRLRYRWVDGRWKLLRIFNIDFD
ncbi:MAG: hypothetical protein JEZ11_04505 [Desulfobacterales bacterium]|nr:hypothetical protein [Desulfobacterales bacterium]